MANGREHRNLLVSIAVLSCGAFVGCAGEPGRDTVELGAPESGGSTQGDPSSGGMTSVDGGSSGEGATGEQGGTGGISSVGAGGTTAQEIPPSPNYGTVLLHPEKLGLYMIPDIPSEYLDWDKTERSLALIHELLPDAWIRWDNETGHHTDTPENVDRFVLAAKRSEMKMIITASAVDGYDNWWANGNMQPTVSILDIANGPYLTFAKTLLDKHENVQFIETINEPDTIWFVSDPDDVEHFDYYMDKLYEATNHDYDHILGPSVAFMGSNLWNDFVAREELDHFSYHTYSGHEGLVEVGEKQVYVTEYGFDMPEVTRDSPAQILADLFEVERLGKLESRIEMIFYVDLQRMMRAAESEGDHFGFSGLLRTLIAYQALARFSEKAYIDPADPRFMATDNEQGDFAALLWNRDELNSISGATFFAPGTSVTPKTPLWVLHVKNEATQAAVCHPLDSQSILTAAASSDGVSITVTDLLPLTAVLVTTEPCHRLAE